MNNEYGIVGCEHCGELVNRNILNDDNICPECLKIIATDKRRGDRSNQLCLTCTKRCKQDSLVNIITCPLYTPKKPSEAQKPPKVARSPKKAVSTPKKKIVAKKASTKKTTKVKKRKR